LELSVKWQISLQGNKKYSSNLDRRRCRLQFQPFAKLHLQWNCAELAHFCCFQPQVALCTESMCSFCWIACEYLKCKKKKNRENLSMVTFVQEIPPTVTIRAAAS